MEKFTNVFCLLIHFEGLVGTYLSTLSSKDPFWWDPQDLQKCHFFLSGISWLAGWRFTKSWRKSAVFVWGVSQILITPSPSGCWTLIHLKSHQHGWGYKCGPKKAVLLVVLWLKPSTSSGSQPLYFKWRNLGLSQRKSNCFRKTIANIYKFY